MVRTLSLHHFWNSCSSTCMCANMYDQPVCSPTAYAKSMHACLCIPTHKARAKTWPGKLQENCHLDTQREIKCLPVSSFLFSKSFLTLILPFWCMPHYHKPASHKYIKYKFMFGIRFWCIKCYADPHLILPWLYCCCTSCSMNFPLAQWSDSLVVGREFELTFCYAHLYAQKRESMPGECQCSWKMKTFISWIQRCVIILATKPGPFLLK